MKVLFWVIFFCECKQTGFRVQSIDNVSCVVTCLHKSHQAWTSWKLGSIAHSHGRKQEILYFLEIALTNSYQLLICQAFTFTTLGFMWK